MSLGLGHSVQIETCLDLVQAALQPLGICAVDPGKAIKSRRPVARQAWGVPRPGRSALRQRAALAGSGAARPRSGFTS